MIIQFRQIYLSSGTFSSTQLGPVRYRFLFSVFSFFKTKNQKLETRKSGFHFSVVSFQNHHVPNKFD